MTVTFTGDLQSFAYAVEHAAKVISLGASLDIIKDVGSAQDVDKRYNVGSFKGTHGLGHVRLATESDVKPEAAHPFWATGFADVAIVHNGQITNGLNAAVRNFARITIASLSLSTLPKSSLQGHL